MRIIQLNPSIPLSTPKGDGLAILATWLSEEHHWLWTVIQDDTGELWTWANPFVRGQKNIQMERIINNNHLKKEAPVSQKEKYKESDDSQFQCQTGIFDGLRQYQETETYSKKDSKRDSKKPPFWFQT